MPIFARRERVTNLKISKLKEEQGRIDFQNAILNAGIEVSEAFFEYNKAKKMEEHRAKHIEQLKRAEISTTSLLQYGGSTYLEVLTAQQNLLQAQQLAVEDRVSTLNATISLYRALGGGRY